MKKLYTIYTLLFTILVSLTTQAQTVFRGTVIDAETKQPIAQARVGIDNQGVGEITNAKGFFNYRKYHEILNVESQLVVGATGYETVRLDAKKVRTLFNRSSKIELQPSSKTLETKEVKNLTVFWDVSEDMKSRDIESEIAYIKHYISNYKDVTLRLVIFDYQIRSDERIAIRDGDMSRFRESVKGLVYNGPSNYDVLDIAEADAVILSSNGNPNYGTFDVSQDVPVYAIVSEDVAVNEDYMESLAQYTQGAYIPLQEYKGIISQNTPSVQTDFVQIYKGPTIQGSVTSLGKPLQEVSIIKKGDLTEYLTKADGSFELPAVEGDILQLRYLGMFPKEVLIENEDDLTIELLPKEDMLDEVVLESRYKKIIVGNKYVRGEKDTKYPGGMTSRGDFFITSEDIEAKGQTLDEVIRLKFSNVQMRFGQDGRYFLVAGVGPQWVLDGAPLTLNLEPPPFYLQDFEIESIIVKESKYSTFRFGPQVKGPAIIVTTKKVPLAKEKYVNSALVKNNEYTEEVSSISNGVIAGKTQIKGKVTSLGKPLQEVSIIKKGDLTEYLTKADGSFELPAVEGDILQLRYLGMFPKDVLVSNQKNIDVELLPENDVLEEVVLETKIEKIIVGTKQVRGRVVSPHIPGGVTSLGDFYITSEDITPSGNTLEQVVRNNFKNVWVSYGSYGIRLSIKGAVIEYWIDGRQVTDSEAFAISDTNIESIVVKENSITTSRYGPLIEDPSIIITTKSSPLAKEKYVNSALVKNNEYTEEVSSISNGVIAGNTQIKGKVTSLGKPLQEVSIIKKGDLTEYLTKADGSFELPAVEGDILQLRYLGMFPKDVLVSNQKNIDVELLPENDVLEEVIIKKKIERIIVGDKEIRGRRLSPDIPGGVTGALDRYITADDIKLNAKTLEYVIKDNFKRVRISYTPQGVRLFIKDVSPAFYIDGRKVFNIDEALAIVDTDIESIIIKDSPTTTSRYGPIIPGFAVIVTTKSVDLSKKKRVNSTLVKGNEYTEEVQLISDGIVSNTRQISGTITSLGKPIQGATITKKGTFEEYTSQADGSFTANVSEGDILAIKYLGMYSKFVVIEDTTKIFDVDLLPKNDLLDEVVLTGDAKIVIPEVAGPILERGQYKLGKSIYNVTTLTRDDFIFDHFVNTIDGLNGKLSGVTKGKETILVRGDSPLFFIDGQLVDALQFENLNPQIIESISVKKSLRNVEGFNKRAIFVNTIRFVDPSVKPPSKLVKGNEYTEEVTSIGTKALNQSSKLQVAGSVKDANGALADATITRKGSFDEVYTDAQGRFEILASLGDILVVSKVGMFTKEVLIESQDMGTIALIAKNDQLDEVVLSGDKRVDNTIESSDGRRVNKDQLGYAVNELTENDFSAGATNLQQLITGKVSGVSVEGGLYSGSQVVYKIRGGNQSITNQIPPIWIVNGTPYQDPPDFLDVQQIASISVLKSSMATSRYGSLAAGGAFLIKTKEVSFQDKAKKAQKSALVSGNEYTESSTRTLDTSSLPEYILRLRAIPNLQDQFELYQRMSRTQESPLEFYVDVANYFDGVNKEMADKVRADLAYISRNNTKALRTLCYIYEAAGDYEKAALVYERILKVAPSEAQSYRDLALVYQEIGKYNEALELYYNMLGEQIKGVNFKGLEKSLKNELSHLLALHKDQVDYARFPNEWLRTDFDIDIRMVIDWSDRTVPFEFQFVNPEKKFFKWTHTLQETRDRLEDEQAHGYQSEEFIIDDAPPGEWLINIQYLGDEGDYVLPPFLKYTVYKNYGTPQETKEIKVVKLFKQSNKVTLGKVVL